MGGGSKGDSQTTEVKLPPELEAFANRNLKNAEAATRIGYSPYEGPTVAAINPMQRAAMGNTNRMANAFGMQTSPVRDSMMRAKDYGGGVRGHDPMALYMQALRGMDPEQRRAIETFTDPRGASAQFGNSRGGGGGGGGGSRSSGGGGGNAQQTLDRIYSGQRRYPSNLTQQLGWG